MFTPSNGKEMRGVEELPAYMLTLGKTDGNIIATWDIPINDISKEKELPTYEIEGWVPILLLVKNMGGMMLAPNILEMGVIVIGVVNMGGLTPLVDIVDAGVWLLTDVEVLAMLLIMGH